LLWFSGYLNTVRVYGGVLTPAQIAVNYSFGPDGAPSNSVPTLAAISDQTVDYGAAISIPLTVGDSDTAIASLTLSGSAATATLIPPGNISFSGTGTSRTMTISTAGLPGTTTISAMVSDGSATASRTFNLTVLSQVETWRKQYFGTTANSGNAADSADPDGDGWTNAQEFAAGTNPTDSTSLLKITQMQTSGADMVMSFPTTPGKTYRVERSDTLQSGSWLPVQDNIPGTGSFIQITDANGAGQGKRFYRILVH